MWRSVCADTKLWVRWPTVDSSEVKATTVVYLLQAVSKELLLSFIWNRHKWPRLFMRTSSKSFHKRNSGDSIWIIHLVYSKTCSYNNNSLFGSVKHYFMCKNKCWERLQCWSGVWCARPRPGAIAWRNRSPTHTNYTSRWQDERTLTH